jgi:phosphoesterase RecJ-like protein
MSIVTENHEPVPTDLIAVPAPRRAAIETLAPELVRGRRVAISTHLNADGDGCGSESALARLLSAQRLVPRIVNPTPWPDMFAFLLGDDVDDQSSRGT